jgi:hypothetical protein
MKMFKYLESLRMIASVRAHAYAPILVLELYLVLVWDRGRL